MDVRMSKGQWLLTIGCMKRNLTKIDEWGAYLNCERGIPHLCDQTTLNYKQCIIINKLKYIVLVLNITI